MYVPSLGGCVSNPAYAKSLDTEYYPVVTSCKATTSTVGQTEEWKYYPSSDGDNNLNFVYWVCAHIPRSPTRDYSFSICCDAQAAMPNRLRPGCSGLYGYKLNGQADHLPYTRPGHNGAIDFKCDASNNRFFVEQNLTDH